MDLFLAILFLGVFAPLQVWSAVSSRETTMALDRTAGYRLATLLIGVVFVVTGWRLLS